MTGEDFNEEFWRRIEALDPNKRPGDELTVIVDIVYEFNRAYSGVTELYVRNRTQDYTVREYTGLGHMLIPQLLADLAAID